MLKITVDGEYRYRIMRFDSIIKKVKVSFAPKGDNYVQVSHPYKAIAVLRYHHLLTWRKRLHISKIQGYHGHATVGNEYARVTLPARFKTKSKKELRKILVPFIMYLFDGTQFDAYDYRYYKP
jgi:hypothetical protein